MYVWKAQKSKRKTASALSWGLFWQHRVRLSGWEISGDSPTSPQNTAEAYSSWSISFWRWPLDSLWWLQKSPLADEPERALCRRTRKSTNGSSRWDGSPAQFRLSFSPITASSADGYWNTWQHLQAVRDTPQQRTATSPISSAVQELQHCSLRFSLLWLQLLSSLVSKRASKQLARLWCPFF